MRRADHAFSLIEVIIVVAICSVVMVLFGSLFFGGWANYEATLARVDLQEKIDNFFIVLTEDVMEANISTISNNGHDLTLTYPSGFSFGSISYSLANGQVTRTTSGAAEEMQTLIAQDVLGTSAFSQDATVSGIVVCQVDLAQQVFGRTVSASGMKRLALRN